MLYKPFITRSKTAGGRAVKFDELVDVVGLGKDVVEFIESFFGKNKEKND